MFTLYIYDLIIEAKHGVHQRERDQSQRFKVSAELVITGAAAAVSDELADTLNWSELRRRIIETVQGNSFNLVERLAREVAARILDDERVQKVTVCIDKLEAFKTGVPGVKIEMSRSVSG